MAGQRKKHNALRTLLFALLLIALAVALIMLVPRAIDSTQATQITTPGQVTLPPTAPAATAVATATSR